MVVLGKVCGCMVSILWFGGPGTIHSKHGSHCYNGIFLGIPHCEVVKNIH